MANCIEKIRRFITRGLVFSFVLTGCADNDKKNSTISIIWEKEKAVGISIPKELLTDIPDDSIHSVLHIRLANNNTSILGEYTTMTDELIFRPLIPLTRGLKYEVRIGNKPAGEIAIPSVNPADAPTIVTVYPALDTVPENLLKFYILFSKPMQEGEALNHILLIKNGSDTLSDVFPDLQNELWNKERTMLTLWLDPGRIKRDLQPNLRLGPPLQRGGHYELLIRNDWQDETGANLKNDHSKKFFTGLHDSISPTPDDWKIAIPESGSKEALEISFNESLDPVLAENTMRIETGGNIVKGDFHINSKGTVLQFLPAESWKPGKYSLAIEARLEDLAGNNLNRLFDADLTQKAHKQQEIFNRSFEIK